MKPVISFAPDAATGELKSAANSTLPHFGNKRDVGILAGGMSVRWVDAQLQLGMPHLKYGRRRVRFDLEEVREWLKSRYGQQRRGLAQGSANPAIQP